MNRVLKITGIVLAAIVGIAIIAALIIYIFFPGLPTYIKVKSEYKYIDKKIGTFQKVDVPESFQTFKIYDISFEMPIDSELSETGHSIKYNDDITLLVTEGDSVENAKQLEEYNKIADSDISTDMWEYYEYKEEDYIHFFKSINADYPTIYEAKNDLLWFIKGGFTAKNCLKLRSDDLKVFKEFADIKESGWELETAYKYNGDGFSGMMSILKDDNYMGTYTTYIYPDDSLTKYYFIFLKGSDEKLKKQIASSIRLAE